MAPAKARIGPESGYIILLDHQVSHYRGASLIRSSLSPVGHHRALGIGLL